MRMKLIRIKDNSQQKKDAFSQVARLTGKIADKTLEQLEREGVFVFPETVKDAEDITQDQMILQSVNDTYRSGNVMGFLGYGDERLVIASRFCGEGEDYFFQYLLDICLCFIFFSPSSHIFMGKCPVTPVIYPFFYPFNQPYPPARRSIFLFFPIYVLIKISNKTSVFRHI